MSWTEAVRQTEDDWVALLSRDGDLHVEPLANLPPDAVARVQAVADFTVGVMEQQSRGLSVLVDTGLGEASAPPKTRISLMQSQKKPRHRQCHSHLPCQLSPFCRRLSPYRRPWAEKESFLRRVRIRALSLLSARRASGACYAS